MTFMVSGLQGHFHRLVPLGVQPPSLGLCYTVSSPHTWVNYNQSLHMMGRISQSRKKGGGEGGRGAAKREVVRPKSNIRQI